MLPIGAWHPLKRGHDNLTVEIEEADDIPADRFASEHSAGNSDLLPCHDCVEVASHENVMDAAEASRSPADALCTPSLAS